MNPIQHPPLKAINRCVRIQAGDAHLLGDLQIPEESSGLVIFAYTCGRSRNNPRNRHAARLIRSQGIGTLMCDLLTEEEEMEDEATEAYRHDADFLAKRLLAVTRWVENEPELEEVRIGYFGACAGGAAALIAAAQLGRRIAAVVCRGGRMDLAREALPRVSCPTLLIVGSEDTVGLELNREAIPLLRCDKALREVEGATHLFGEPGMLKQMAQLSGQWFRDHLIGPANGGGVREVVAERRLTA